MALSYSDKIETEFGSFIPKNWSAERIKFCVTYNDESLADTTDPEFEITYVDISSVDLIKGITNTEIMPFSKAPSRARRKVKHGDTIVSTVRTYLKAIAPIKDPVDNLVVSTGFAVLRPTEKVSSRYLSYFFQSQDFVDAVGANSVGVSYPAINPSSLVCIPCTYPKSNDEQIQIAKFLDYKTAQIDRLIEKKKALIEKLNEQRIAMITQAVTKGLNPDAPMKDSEVDWLGEVPEHWETRRLKLLAKEPLKYGANEAASLTDRSLPRYIRITDVKEDGSLYEETFRSLENDLAEPYLLQEGDILLARSGATVGKCFQYDESWGQAAYAGYLIRFRTDEELIDAKFAYYFLRSSSYWANINSTLIQSTIQNFSAEKYGNILVPLPPVKEQREIVHFIKEEQNKLDSFYNKANEVIFKLEEYRTALITSAVTGKIDVREVNVPAGF